MASLLATVMAAVSPRWAESAAHLQDDNDSAIPTLSLSTSSEDDEVGTRPALSLSTPSETETHDKRASAIAVAASVMSAEAIKNDAGRMSAAIALMTIAPSLSADAVTNFVVEHVAAAGSNAAPAQAATLKDAIEALPYAERRKASQLLAHMDAPLSPAALLAMPGGSSRRSDGGSSSLVEAMKRRHGVE